MSVIRQNLLFCAAAASLALALSGCGGTTFSKSSTAPSPYSDPVVQGLEPQAAVGGGNLPNPFLETSGLGSPDGTIGYITGAVNSDSVAISAIAISTGTDASGSQVATTPLGFAPGGQYFSSQGGAAFLLADNLTPAFQAAKPGASVIFRASVANGVDPTTSPPSAPPIVPGSIKLTSTDPAWHTISGLKTDDPTDAPNGYLPLAFDKTFALAPSGPLANDNYVTGAADASGNLTGSPIAFALPFTTTGLHNLRVTVADTRAAVHHTDFQALVVAPSDSAIIVQATDAKGNPLGGAVVTLDSGKITPTAPALDQTTTDPLTGVAIIFATPAKHTITITSQDAKGNAITGTDTVDLTGLAGKAFNTADGSTPYQIAVGATPAAAAAIKSAAKLRLSH